MTDETPLQDAQALERSLTNARQNLVLLRSQVQAGQIDADFFLKRLENLETLLNHLADDRQSQADTKRFSRLYDVSQVIGSSLDLKEVLNRVMDAIIGLTGAERGFLMLLNDDGQLEVRIARNLDQETLDSGEFAVSRTITHQVFETGEPVVTTNAAEDPRYAGQASIVAHGLRSIMASPLRSRGSNIGVIYVDNRVRTGLFRETDLELLEAFAGQAAVAIDNARLFGETDEKLSRRVEELQTLQWIDRQLNENLDVSKAMDVTVEWTHRMVQAQGVNLAMRERDSQVFQVMSQVGETGEFTTGNTANLIDASHPLVAKMLESDQAALQIDEENHRATFCVPIRRENTIIGVMIVTAQGESPFDTDAQALLARIADRAAIAIENARLYDAVRQANAAKSEFVGTVAHELKVPMTGIRGYADLLEQFGELDARSQDFVGRIKGSVTRMQTLVEDLSDISRIESGNLRVELTQVDVAEVIAEAKASTMAQIEEREHQLIEQIDD
ncbi:MAG: GAF domain-containing protein, partial [Anaerolineales bacterium]